MISEITQNRDFLNRLFNKGLLSSSFFLYYQICLAVDKEMRLNKTGKTQAVTNIAEEFHVSEQTVYTALKKML